MTSHRSSQGRRRLARTPGTLLGVGSLCTAAAVTTALLLPNSSSASAAEGPSIHDIQGSTRVSPLVGRTVTDVVGIVTGVRDYGSRGFWMQEPHPDGDPATSEGIFVYTGSDTPQVSPGDKVRVAGTVEEYVPGGADSGNQSVTQIASPRVEVVSSGNPLPAPVHLGDATVPDRYAPTGDPDDDGDISRLPLQPGRWALDLYESLEGMYVEVRDARVVGPSTEHHELWVTVKPGQNPTPRGGTRYASYGAQNSGRLKITSLTPVAEQPFPTANVGDVLTGTTAGPLDYDAYGGYLLAARELGRVEDGTLERETTRRQQPGELAIATYNVENLHPGDSDEKFTRLAEGVAHHLASPDIVALEEIQDDSGSTDDGTVSAEKTLRRFTEAIRAAGGPAYAWRSIDPVDGADGGQPGGNIRVAFLYNPARVSFVDRPGGDATTAVEPVRNGGRAALSHSPGRVAPDDPAWRDSRKPLVGEFRFRGRTVFVIANHFSSKGGDEPLHGLHQPPRRPSEEQRVRQATVVNAFVRDLQAIDHTARIVVLGDLNDFEFSPTTKALTAKGALRSLVHQLPAEERYTYLFQGNAQVLDQTLVSPAIRDADYDIVHVNTEFADQVSDHDPQVVRFRP